MIPVRIVLLKRSFVENDDEVKSHVKMTDSKRKTLFPSLDVIARGAMPIVMECIDN